MIKNILFSALLVFFITACATTPKDTADTSGSGSSSSSDTVSSSSDSADSAEGTINRNSRN